LTYYVLWLQRTVVMRVRECLLLVLYVSEVMAHAEFNAYIAMSIVSKRKREPSVDYSLDLACCRMVFRWL